MKKNIYDEYCISLEEATDKIKLPKSIKTKRKGSKKIRDRLVYYKSAWQKAESWAGMPKALVYWLALTPLAISSFNGFMDMLGLDMLEIPLEWGATLAVTTILIIMIFGLMAWTKLGLVRRTNELGAKQSPQFLLLYDEIKNMQGQLDELKKEKER